MTLAHSVHPARALPLAFALACTLVPASARAQETDTVRLGQPDTLRPAAADTFVVVDSILEPDDTLPAGAGAADSLARVAEEALAPILLPRPVEPGFAENVWVWDRAALLRSPALSVGELLERVPGLVRVRSGFYGQPEFVTAPAALSGDVRIYYDGVPLDPFTSTTYDLSRVSLIDLHRIRVERRGGQLRVELYPLVPSNPRRPWPTSSHAAGADSVAPVDSAAADSGARPAPWTLVQIVTGDFDTDGLGGAFLAPHFLFGPFGVAIERRDSDGLLRRQPARTSSAWLRWGVLRPRWGVHAEYRRAGIERTGSSPGPGEATRSDVSLHARVRPWSSITAEVYAARAELDDVLIDTVSNEFTLTHGGVRAAFDRPWLGTQAAVRFRNGGFQPDLSAELIADARPVRFLGLTGEVRRESWGGDGLLAWNGAVRVGPWLGTRLFAEVADGDHGIHWLARPEGSARVERRVARGGVDWRLGGWHVGGAALRLEGDSVAPPALPLIGPWRADTLALFPGFDLSGWELIVRVPLAWNALAVEGNYTRYDAGSDGRFALFQPVEQARAALVYHGMPLDTDQLEIEVRVEGEYRGEMRVPADTIDGSGAVAVAGAQRLNLDLSIRVIDVHAFLRWQNILHDQALLDLPGRTLPGQSAHFGVRWELRN